MFRSTRFCYSLTNNYRKLNSANRKNILNLDRINSVSRATYSVRENKSSPLFEHENMEIRACPITRNFSETSKYLSKVLTSDRSDVNWKELLTHPNFPKESGINSYAMIFLLCRKQKFYKCGMSFFDYLWERNEVTAGLFYLFCGLILDSPENFKCYEELIFQVFQNTVHTDKITARLCSNVLIQSSKYSNAVFGSYKDHLISEKNHTALILSLLAANKINEAIDLYVHGNERVLYLEKMILIHFLEETLAGSQTTPAICKFLDDVYKMKSELIINNDNVTVLESLFKKLRTVDQNYAWIVNKGTIQGNTCAFCNGKLLTTNVTKEEIDELLEDLEESVIIQDTIYLKSNHEEWKHFCNFIEKEDYNLVMDGLNMKHALGDLGRFKSLIDKITYHGLTPCILARAHFKTSPEYKIIKNRFPIFLTENLSDDDVFVLYAALRKGKGCYTLSNDKMKFCNSLLSSQNTLHIYKRWQATHWCKLSYWKSLIFPHFMLDGLQKSEECVEDEFKYHYISCSEPTQPTLICISRIKKEKEF